MTSINVLSGVLINGGLASLTENNERGELINKNAHHLILSTKRTFSSTVF